MTAAGLSSTCQVADWASGWFRSPLFWDVGDRRAAAKGMRGAEIADTGSFDLSGRSAAAHCLTSATTSAIYSGGFAGLLGPDSRVRG